MSGGGGSELKKRVITGVMGGVILLLAVIFGGRIGTALLAVILSLGMFYEFIEMSFSLPDKDEKRLVLLGSTWLLAFANFWIPRAEYELLLLMFFGFFTYFLFTAERHGGEFLQTHFRELVYSFFGGFYLAFLPLFLILIQDAEHGIRWTVFFFLLNWVNDSVAYFVGKKYGKRRLYFRISPKKTVEGAVGGVAGGILFALLYKTLFFWNMPWAAVLLIPLFVGSAAQLGDLCESFLKRAHFKKDSGSILPGHGGFLDRFDGVVFSLPVMYACMRLLG